MKNLLIIGGGGHGRVVADCAQACGRWRQIRLLDDRYPELPRAGRWQVVGTSAEWPRFSDGQVDVLVGIGDNASRLGLQRELEDAGCHLPALVHPRAWVSPDASIGAGSVVFAGGMVNIGAHLGDAVIVNTGATVDHDCILAEGVHLSPGVHLGGNVTIGPRSWLGLGAVVRNGVVIGSDAMIGAGAAVVSDLADGITVVGVPARPVPADG